MRCAHLVLPFLIGLPFLIPYFLSSIRMDDPVTKHCPPPQFFVVQAPNSIWGTLHSHYLSSYFGRSLHADFGIGSGNSDRVKQMVAPGMEILCKCTQIGQQSWIHMFFSGAIKKRWFIFCLKCQNGVGSLKQWDTSYNPIDGVQLSKKLDEMGRENNGMLSFKPQILSKPGASQFSPYYFNHKSTKIPQFSFSS